LWRSVESKCGDASLSLTGFAAVAFAAVLYDWGEQRCEIILSENIINIGIQALTFGREVS
jgi:hypothetical protein